MLSRREVMHVFAAIAAAGCSSEPNNAQPPAGVDGCTLSGASAASFTQDVKLLPTCGVPLIDQMMPAEVGLLNRVFRVFPSFAFFNDGDGPNAFATTARIAGPSQHGSVCFGISLLRSELNRQWWGAAIAGIGAHEWAHIAQAHSGVGGPTPLRELHADFMAGWYLGAKAQSGTFVVIEGLGESLFAKGDFNFNAPEHHGTPQQRVSAMRAGFDLAMRGIIDVAQAFQLGRQQFGV